MSPKIKHSSAPSSVRHKLLIPLTCVLLLLVGGGAASLLLIQQRNMKHSSQHLMNDVGRSFDIALKQNAKILIALEDALLQNPELHDALETQNRNRLLTLFETTYQKLNNEYSVTHFYFHRPDRINLLRVHKPEKHGDLIDRFTLHEAENSGKTTWGVELGPLGTVTLRVVQPVYTDDRLVGYLELGQGIEELLHLLQKSFDVELLMTINKDSLERQTWESGMKMLGRESNWERYQNTVVIYCTQNTFLSEMDRVIPDDHRYRWDNLATKLWFDSKSWQLIALPLKDASGSEVGDLSIIRDTSCIKEKFTRIVTITFTLTLLLLGAVLTFYSKILRQTDREISKQQKELQRSEMQFRGLVDSSRDWIWAVDINGKYTYAGPQVEDILGYKPEEVLGKTPFDMMPPEEADRVAATFKELAGEATPIVNLEKTALHKDGRLIILETFGVPVFDEAGKMTGYLGVDRDLTEQKHSKTIVYKSEEQWNRTFNSFPDIVTLQDTDLRIVKANQTACANLELPCDEIVGHHCHELFHDSEEPCHDCPLLKTRNTVVPYSREMYHEKLQKTFLVSAAPVLDEHGELEYIAHVAKDITELKRLEGELLHSQKMEAVGTLAGGIAHDFNNILSALIGYAEFIQEAVPADSAVGRDIHQILRAGNRATDLVKQILTFSRKVDLEKYPLRPHLIVEEALKLMHASLPTTITIETQIDPDCGIVVANSGNIHQIIVNLCTNAMHAMTEGKGTLRVELHRRELSRPDLPINHTVSSGSFMLLTVSDTGCGIDKETVNRIFDPYFTTKEVGKGSGLGLAVVHGIVQDCNGFMEVESSVGKGTTFSVYIPITEKEAPRTVTVEQKDRVEAIPGDARILVVDDELLLVKINEKRLKSRGYQVTALSDSKEALELFRSQPEDFDILITDQTMPGLTGAELAKAALEIKPSLAIIMCTGHSDIVSEEEAIALGIKKYVFKPLHGDELLDAVQEVLSER